jgi:hypothetical protein
LLLILAWGLWLWRLDASDLTFDETATYFIARRPFLDILRYLREAVREHPPVYYVLVHGWMVLAGASEFSLRFFSVAMGMIVLALMGWLARLACRGSGCPAVVTGLLAAAILAIVPGMAYYVRDARMYSLGTVWAVLSAGLFLRDWLSAGPQAARTRAARRWPAPTALVALPAVHLLALFTHYYLLLPVLVQPIVLLVTRRWRPLLAWCGSHGLPALAGLGWLWLSPGLQMSTGDLWHYLFLVEPTCSRVFRLLGEILFSPVVPVRSFPLCVLLVLTAGGVLFMLRRHWVTGTYLALALAMPVAMAYVLPHPPTARHLIFLIPMVALALDFLCVAPRPPGGFRATGAGQLKVALGCPTRAYGNLPYRISSTVRSLFSFCKGKRSGFSVKSRVACNTVACNTVACNTLARCATASLALAIAGLLIDNGLYVALTFDRSHYGRTLETVKAYVRPGDGMLFYGPWQSIQFHYYDPGGMPPITLLPRYAPPRLRPAEAEPVLEDLLAQYNRLWVLPAAVEDVDPPHYVEGWLKTHAHAVWQTWDFSLYLPPLPADAPTQGVGEVFGQVLCLEQVAREGKSVPAGEPLRLTLYWRALHRLENDVRLTLALVDQTGYIWQVTHSLPGAWVSPPSTWQLGQIVADREGLIVPQGAPPGEYSVRLMVSDAGTDEPLRLEGENLPEGGKELDVLVIQVTEPVRAPVLHALPHAEAAEFCLPDETLCLTLAGYEPGGARFQQGHPVPFTLHWLSPSSPLPDLQLRLRVTPRSGLSGERTDAVYPRSHITRRAVGTSVQSCTLTRTLPLAPTYPASSWAPDRLVTMPAVLTLPPDASAGPAQVTLEVLGADGVALLPFTGEGKRSDIRLFDITVERRPVLRRLPDGLTPIQVDFGDEVGLRGYRVEGDPRPGGHVRLTYAWYAKTHPTAIYAVFNHLVDADGAVVAQVDGWPQDGQMLTTQWQVGEYVEDGHGLTIPPDAPPGPYTLYVGLYNAANNERQPAFLNGQRVPEDRVPIPVDEAATGGGG